jgi:hypothetical protein
MKLKTPACEFVPVFLVLCCFNLFQVCVSEFGRTAQVNRGAWLLAWFFSLSVCLFHSVCVDSIRAPITPIIAVARAELV